MIIARCLFCIGLLPAAAFAESSVTDVTNIEEIAKNLKLTRFEGMQFVRHIKVAVLDNGFYGYQDEIGKNLPENTVYHPGKTSDADSLGTTSSHGLFMAELMSQIVKKAIPKVDFEIHLFNSFGYTKFEDAVNTVIKEHFDVVLCSQLWEFGGSGDSKGFINAVVDRAIGAKVLWINAAGAFGRTTRLAPVQGEMEGEENWVVFKNEKNEKSNAVKLTCTEKPNCKLRLVLAWNRFANDPETGTDFDLDLFLYHSGNQKVASSERKQRLTADPQDKDVSILPREWIETEIENGVYNVRVKINSKGFDPVRDRLRLTASGSGVEIENPSIGETLLPPADNLGAIVVGDSDDIDTSQSVLLKRPDISFPGLVRLKDGSTALSSSNAAAMATALTVLELGIGVGSSRDEILRGLKIVSQTKIADVPKDDKTNVPSPAASPPVGGGTPVGPSPTPAPSPIEESRTPAPPEHTHPPPPPPPLPPPQEQEQDLPVDTCWNLGTIPEDVPGVSRFTDRGARIITDDNGRPAIVVHIEDMDLLGLPPHSRLRAFLTPKGMAYLDSRQVLAGLPPDHYEVFGGDRPVCK